MKKKNEKEVARMTGGLVSLFFSLRDYFIDYCNFHPDFCKENEELIARVKERQAEPYSYGLPIDQMIAALNKTCTGETVFGTLSDGRGVGWICPEQD